MLNEINAENVAIVIFDGTRWEASEEDIKLLARNLLALDKRGMHELNKRLVDGGNKVWDTFAEHNFAYELISFNDFSVPILYEPNEVDGRILRRPPDFVIKKNSLHFGYKRRGCQI